MMSSYFILFSQYSFSPNFVRAKHDYKIEDPRFFNHASRGKNRDHSQSYRANTYSPSSINLDMPKTP